MRFPGSREAIDKKASQPIDEVVNIKSMEDYGAPDPSMSSIPAALNAIGAHRP